jgi:hypothetical protein
VDSGIILRAVDEVECCRVLLVTAMAGLAVASLLQFSAGLHELPARHFGGAYRVDHGIGKLVIGNYSGGSRRNVSVLTKVRWALKKLSIRKTRRVVNDAG